MREGLVVRAHFTSDALENSIMVDGGLRTVGSATNEEFDEYVYTILAKMYRRKVAMLNRYQSGACIGHGQGCHSTLCGGNVSHYDDHCAWCNISIKEICLYEIAVYDEEDNEVGYEYICRHCLGSWHW